MSANLFDLTEHYTTMLEKGIRLSGEDQHFFIRGRLNDLSQFLASHDSHPRRILDFGCGLGHTTAEFADRFPDATLLGVDTASQAIDYARTQHGSSRITFEMLERFIPDESFDLCYCNGVFHHIPLNERGEAMAVVYRALMPGGRFALFENNPLNPGTRMVMRRIPFDHDANTLLPWETIRLLRRAGFQVTRRPRFLFYFPRAMSGFRSLEPYLSGLPFGAQYWAVGSRPIAH
jgi:SAM-dependent methyltransferase